MTDQTIIVSLVGALVGVVGAVVVLAKLAAKKRRDTATLTLVTPENITRLEGGIVRVGDLIEAKHRETSGRLDTLSTEIKGLRDWRHDMTADVARADARIDMLERRIDDRGRPDGERRRG